MILFSRKKVFWHLCYLHQSTLKETSTFATFLNQLALIIRPLFTIDRLCLQCTHIYVIAIKVSIWLLQLERHRINVEPSLYSKIIINISWHNHRKIDSSRNCNSLLWFATMYHTINVNKQRFTLNVLQHFTDSF